MSAADALRTARAAGIELRLEGDDLLLTASAPPPPCVLDLLKQHKAGIIPLLRRCDDGWSGENWQAYFDERAGIAEHAGGLSRAEAEARAFACCVAEWLNRNPVRSPPGCCLGCGASNHASDALLPFGTEQTGHAWLHSGCWDAWHASREAEAIVALAALGIAQPRANQ